MATLESTKQTEDSHDSLPPLIKLAISAYEVAGFNSFASPLNNPGFSKFGIEAASAEQTRSVSISMPPAEVTKQAKFHSQPMLKLSTNPVHHDKRFDSFKTWSGKLERQLSNLKPSNVHEQPEPDQQTHLETIPVHRYFDALEGPELDTLRASEEIVLPEDKRWPFLLRFPISSFGICLGVGSQAIMWKNLSSSPATAFLGVSPHINLVLWCISVALTSIVAAIYGLKVVFYFEAVRREYYHPVRANFFFAPWIALLFLAMGVPPAVAAE